jgi:two-component system, LuxR family, response regulator FixJ
MLKVASTANNTQKHVFLIEDHDELRDDLTRILQFVGYVVHAFPGPIQFLEYDKHLAPAVVVSDMLMPHMTGVELQERLKELGRTMPMIIISGESTDQQIITALKNGAIDFLLKPFSRESLFAAVAKGIEIDSLAMNNIIRVTEFNEKLKILSPRERQVFQLLSQGLNNRELMESLNISLPTAKQYKSEVMYKLRLHSLSELIALSAKI